MTSWFRSWHGAPTDNKWLVIAKRSGVSPGIVSAIAWALMDFASANEDRGSVKDFDVETYSIFSGFDETQCNAVIAAMREKEIIIDDRLTSWEKRQPKREDNSSGRVKKYREKSKTNEDETQCNAPVTQCNAPEQNRADTEQKDNKKLFEKEFDEEFWPMAVKKKSVGSARKAYLSARSKAEKDQILNPWRTHNALWKPKKETDDWKFVPYPATWLNEERWADEAEGKTVEDIADWPEWRRRLADQIGEPAARSWFHSCEVNGSSITMKNKFMADYVKSNYFDAVTSVFGKEMIIKPIQTNSLPTEGA